MPASPLDVPNASGLQLAALYRYRGAEVAQQASCAGPWDLPDAEEAQDVVYPVGVEVPARPGSLCRNAKHGCAMMFGGHEQAAMEDLKANILRPSMTGVSPRSGVQACLEAASHYSLLVPVNKGLRPVQALAIARQSNHALNLRGQGGIPGARGFGCNGRHAEQVPGS